MGELDFAFVGGGLAGAVTALALKRCAPTLDIALIERGTQIGAGRTWSYFASDLDPRDLAWLEPLSRHAWPRYEVRFPRFTRVLETPYRILSGDLLGQRLAAELGPGFLSGRQAVAVAGDSVTLDDGAVLRARTVFDGRGATAHASMLMRYQKFFGQVVRLQRPHGLAWPIVMDATGIQDDGFRFFYSLPLDEMRLLIEDTRYSDSPDISADEAAFGIAGYARRQGWQIAAVEEVEQGLLPVVLDGDIEAYWRAQPAGAAPLGVRAGLFHPTTSYSLPTAVATARLVAGALPRDTAAARRLIHDHALRLWSRRRYYRRVNRMLFLAGVAEERWRIFERFYSLPEPLIRNFYAGRMTPFEQVRLLVGRPPVSFFGALAALPETRTRAMVKGRS